MAAVSANATMIQTKIQYNLKTARQYFREHLGLGDYYSEDKKVLGEWLGQGADKLGLDGPVTEKSFIALCEGLHPQTGLKLGQRMNSVRREGGRAKANRRVFFDFTMAPPKSVSIVALYQDERIVGLHEKAVRLALSELEKCAETRVRKSSKNGERVTGNIISACFRHETSRELDPHLHTHCVVMNATFDPVEDRWKALEPSGMYRAHRFATNLYRHELAKGLRALGYEILNHPTGFEIKNVPASAIERFSKRHHQIDEETRRLLQEGKAPLETTNVSIKDLREQIAHGNRRRKLKNSNAERLRARWRGEMPPEEVASLKALTTIAPLPAIKPDLPGIMQWAEQYLFERRSVVHEHELLAAALERGRGLDFDLDALRQALSERGYLKEPGTDKLTVREVFNCELAVVMAAADGRGRFPALNPNYQASPALSHEQAMAVKKILGSCDFITLFRGGAGTGKSFTLKEVERGLAAAQKAVVVLTPQRQQAQDLQADGLEAETLASFLQRKQLPPNAVVMVDEAGQVGAQQLAELICVVQSNGGRLILSGDTRQHGAVAFSDALRAIEKHAGLKPAVLRSIRRQDPSRAGTSAERAFIRHYRNAVKLAAEGKTVESFDALDRLGCIREVAVEDYRNALASEYLAAVERKERVLAVAQTREEVRQTNEAIRAKLFEAGIIGRGVRIDTCQPVDLNAAQKVDPRFYQSDYHVCFVRGYGRFAKGDICPVVGTDDHGVILEKDGVSSRVSFRYAERFIAAMPVSLEVAPGDRLQVKFNGNSREGHRINNGELVTVQSIADDGAVVVKDARGIEKTMEPAQRLFVRGYAVTSYGSQGKTVDTVLMADAGNQAATHAHQWYVSVSRGRKQVIVFTPDKTTLREHVRQAGERELALDLKLGMASSVDARNRVSRQCFIGQDYLHGETAYLENNNHHQRGIRI
ncbi:conjugal transfer protein [Termitidicoccus mucosus]|uniref:Conjugal transfer protein n=2 Tax=Termitidicoccus mucosus TaxID=1184151 RepID=A0A178IN36_9BACT|nr:conjugal transfer protein [Opitutaceae bacterium TSB47]